MSRRPLGLLLGGVFAIVAVAAAITAFTGGGGRESSEPSFGPARDGVCQAAEAARTGDTRRARAVFFDRSHQPLHELAAAAQERDRAATARLLEAKERVESGLERRSPTLPQDFDALAAVTGRAMAVVGSGDPGPCQ
ncbi:MAG: hypothetical protein Q8K72_11910 [Acidimicrobiales bacterium]|nr:hypothetical protein [Acidimicrobiales bacterium]